MSDALLDRLATAAEGILAHLKGSAATAGQKNSAPAGNSAAAPTDAAKKAAAAEAAKKAAAADAAKKAAAADAAKKAAAAAAKGGAAGPAGNTKAPGGKFSFDQVRDYIRQVATKIDKQSATDILDQDGGGVARASDLKPENYDKVCEACQVLLNSEGGGTSAAPEDDLM